MIYGNELVLDLGEGSILYTLPKDLDYSLISTVGVFNDWYIKKKIPKKSQLMIRVEHLWELDYFVNFQSRFILGRVPDIIVFKTQDKLEDYPDLSTVLDKFENYGIDLGEDNNLELVMEYEGILGHLPSYIFCQVNPMKYSSDVIEFCKLNGITLIATNIFGNPESEVWMKKSFTVGYLERFALSNSDGIVLSLSGRSFEDLSGSIALYSVYHGKELGSSEEELFRGKEFWADKLKSAEKVIYSYDNLSYEVPDPFNYEVSDLGFRPRDFKVPDDIEVLDNFKFPSGFTALDKLRYSFMIGISELGSRYPGYSLSYEVFGGYLLVYLKHFWSKRVFLVSSTPDSPFLVDLKDSKSY